MLSRTLKIFATVLTVVTLLTACIYYPPDGYTEEHHTYEEACDFAMSIDSDAAVSKEYTDSISDSWSLDFREWNAVINGVDCHVTSAGDLVWNRGILGGEFPKQFYRVDTDYDYYILKSVLEEKESEWKIARMDIYARYNTDKMIFLKNPSLEERRLTEDELDAFFNEVCEIEESYRIKKLDRKLGFYLTAPSVVSDANGENKRIIIEDVAFLNIYENGKSEFFDEYNSKWDRLNSGLPIKE